MKTFKELAIDYHWDHFDAPIDAYAFLILEDENITTATDLHDVFVNSKWTGEELTLSQYDAALYAFQQGAHP